MDLNYLRKLVKIFDDSKATEFKIEEEGVKIVIAQKNNLPSQAQVIPMMQAATGTPAVSPAQATAVVTEDTVVENADDGLHQIKSPIVGTFYKAPSPESPAFVEVGTHVTAGSTLCIVEAMKLMNEIETDVSGTVEKVIVENAQPVEYDQVMFLIKPD